MFDMDGTFIDSKEFHTKVFYQYFNRYVMPVDIETVRQGMGNTVRDIFRSLNVEETRFPELFEKLDEFCRTQIDGLIEKIQIAEDIEKTLEGIEAVGIKSALVTNSMQCVAERILEIHNLKKHFSVVSGADLASLNKNRRCEKIRKEMGLERKQILYVGDAENDMILAKEMGYDSCFADTVLSWCRDKDYVMSVLRPAYTVKSLYEITEIMRKQAYGKGEEMADFNVKENKFDYVRGYTIDLDLKTGMSRMKETSKRYLSQMKGMFADDEAYEKMLKEQGDVLVYEFHEMGVPEEAGNLAFGCSITYPGKVGDEYFMTKGHFHTILETAEVYYCLSGHGYMLMENPEGDWLAYELTPGKALYVPERYAHRSINVDPKEPLRTFFVFRADAGHDYGTIETKGYRKLLVEREGKPEILDNPKWK